MQQKKKREPTQFAEYEFLLRILNIVLKYKYRILLFSIVVTSAVIGLSLLQPNKYSAYSVVAFNLNQNRGGVTPGNYRGNSTLNVLEYDLIIDQVPEDEKDRHLTLMKSFGFLSQIIEKHQLKRTIFHEAWDAQNEQWLEGKEPSDQEAVDAFRSGYFGIAKYGSTDMVTVAITSLNPKLSQVLSNDIPRMYNEYNLNREISELDARRAYLEKRLSEVRSKESQQSIYRLLESLLAVESLLYAKNNYPLEIIIPASEPRFKSSPKRKVWAIGGFVGSVAFAIFAVLALSIFTTFRRDLQAFSEAAESTQADSSTTPESDGDEWVDKN